MEATRVDNSYTSDYPRHIHFTHLQGKKTMRDAAINLRARPMQRDLIDHAAQLLGKNRSDFMLEAACDKARSVLLDQVFFGLDEARFQSFVQMLDAPVAPNVGLDRLMAVKPVWQAV
jgi:uncharacterized protein (DUF1778 family)